VLDAFLDETEKQHGERLTGVGGVLFRKDAMTAFKRELFERTGGTPFHAAHCNAQRGAYDGWNPDDCYKLTADVGSIIARHRGAGFVCVVSDDDFAAMQKSSGQNNAE